MRELGLVDPMSLLALDEWEVEREKIVMNRKLGEGAFGMVYGGEMGDEDRQWVGVRLLEETLRSYHGNIARLKVAVAVKTLKAGSSVEEKVDFLSEADMMKR